MATKKATAPITSGGNGLVTRVDLLEQRVEALEKHTPGRKAKPMIAIRQPGVCALDPGRDSNTCPEASIFRYQKGCHGNACRAKQHDAYVRRKDTPAPAKKTTKKAAAKKAPAKVDLKAEVTKAAAKRTTPTKKAAPVKKAPVKKAASA